MLFFSFSFSQWSAEFPTIERHAVFVENTEHGTAAVESAYFPDVINGMTVVVHRHDCLFPFRLADVLLFGWLVNVLFQVDNVG